MENNKKLVLVLVLFTIFILVFGYFNIKERIFGPFRVPKTEKIALTNEEIEQILAEKDTDGDGLSDSDEIFKYHTSIYLVDSDSDGYSDKEEVEAGSDPTNPESTPFKKVAEKKILTEELELSKENKEPDPKEIREMLIKAGLSREVVEKVDDETLKRLYNETVEETGINLKKLIPGDLSSFDISKILEESSSKKEEVSDFEKLTPQEIRQLLLAAGADPEILNKIDDQTLKTLFLQALRQKE